MSAALGAPALADIETQLRAGCASLGLDLRAGQIQALLDYLDMLGKWGATFNLTSVKDPKAMVVTHLLDSLSIAPLVSRQNKAHWLDIGSGAGLPGIPLAIALPALQFTTVDTVQKKIAFQTQVKGALKLANVQPVHARVQALTNIFDGVVFRAFASLQDGLAAAEPHLAQDGVVVAMKGNPADEEMQQISELWDLKAVESLKVPGLFAQRCAVVLHRRLSSGSIEMLAHG